MLDPNDLLIPIPGTSPVGENLSFSLEYDAIQEARRADDPSLEQGEWITDLKVADWTAVEKQSAELLQQRSKDLHLAVWWAEAQTHLHGFAGLRRGYLLMAGLCDRYWDDVHPQVEDGDLEQRIGNLDWLISRSGQWLRRLPLTDSSHGSFSLADFEAARLHHDGEGMAPSLETLESARRHSPHAFYARLSELIPACRQALATLEQSVDARLGQDGPSFTALRDQLAHLGDTINRFARDAGVLVDTDDAGTTEVPDGSEAAAPVPALGNHAITTRKEAIAQLRRVAEFFRRSEPHSPVAYLADKAAQWGEMPLHVWLRRVVKDDATLAQMEELLGVTEPANSSSLD
ncbi:type VI secretion system protein TssA [Lysobacter sp. A421]